jgi:hypothetical protein
MGLTVIVMLLAALAGWVSGGRAGRIRGHRLRTPALLLASVSVLFCEPLLGASGSPGYRAAVILATTLMLQFAMRNLHVPGIPLAALGMLLNAIVVVANGAMPVDLESADRAGVATAPISAGTDHNHVVSGRGTEVPALADRVAVPLPGHREIDSLGDIAIAAGAGLCVFTALRRRRGVFDPTAPWLLQGA